jgi:hypothetical protein
MNKAKSIVARIALLISFGVLYSNCTNGLIYGAFPPLAFFFSQVNETDDEAFLAESNRSIDFLPSTAA